MIGIIFNTMIGIKYFKGFYNMKKIIILSALLFAPFSFAENNLAAISSKNMVASSQAEATRVGNEILSKGGNAIDAAVAIGYALAVIEPCCGNIGGGGFMLIRFNNGKTAFLNFREKAPLAAKPNLYLNARGYPDPKKTLGSYLAVAVPGTVLGLETAREKYGRLSRAEDLAPAIRLAKKGYVLQPFEIMRLKQANIPELLHQHFQVGQIWRQPQLAKTLMQIAEFGPHSFYQGEIAKKIVAASKKQGGILTLNDFSQYQVKWERPIICRYQHAEVITASPPSSGGIMLCEMLKMLEQYPLKQMPLHSAQSIHYIVEAMRRAFYDRNQLGDPDFVNIPSAALLSPQHIKELLVTFNPNKATPSKQAARYEAKSYDTTHYSVVDQDGNAVAVTYSLNGLFGSRLQADDTGFFLNNAIDDFNFTSKYPNQFGLIQGKNNLIQGGKRPLSSMTPTIVTHDNKLFLVLGAPGGPRIITQLLQIILNIVDYKLNLFQAVNLPRFHHQWLPDVIYYEKSTMEPSEKIKLQQMGYLLEEQSNWGAIEAIQYDPNKNILYGMNDKRRPDGLAQGAS